MVKIKLINFNKPLKRPLSICLRDRSQIYVNLFNPENKLFIKNKKKTLRLEKYSQFKTTKYMYSEILRNNFKNICSFKEAQDILEQIKNSKKINF